jgi:hypothetical protein
MPSAAVEHRQRFQMRTMTPTRNASKIPKRRQKHYSYNESVDESAKLIEDEPVDIEKAVPAEENEPLERIDKDITPDTPAFEE